MSSYVPWTGDELERALEMRAAHETYADIGKAFGRTAKAVEAAILRHHTEKRENQRDYEYARYVDDAKLGSLALLQAIERAGLAA